AAALAVQIMAGTAWSQPASITVYTSQPSQQMQAVVAAFNKDHPEIKVDVFRSGTTEIMSKLQAEFAARHSPADVVLLPDAVAITQLKNDGRLLAYSDAPVGKLPASLVDPDRTYFGTKLITTGIIYNTKLVQKAPSSWTDLLAPETAAKTIMPSPLYSG